VKTSLKKRCFSILKLYGMFEKRDFQEKIEPIQVKVFFRKDFLLLLCSSDV